MCYAALILFIDSKERRFGVQSQVNFVGFLCVHERRTQTVSVHIWWVGVNWKSFWSYSVSQGPQGFPELENRRRLVEEERWTSLDVGYGIPKKVRSTATLNSSNARTSRSVFTERCNHTKPWLRLGLFYFNIISCLPNLYNVPTWILDRTYYQKYIYKHFEFSLPSHY